VNAFEKYFPWGLVGLGAFYLIFFFVPRDDDPKDFAYERFARLPVMDNGRIKPMDTVARVNLMIISGGRQSWTDENGDMQSAARWLLDTMSTRFEFERAVRKALEDKAVPVENVFSLAELPAPIHDAVLATPAAKHKVFRIDNDEVLSLLGLTPRPRFRYALTEFGGRLKDFFEVHKLARATPPESRSLYYTKVVEVGDRLDRYYNLAIGLTPLAVPALRGPHWVKLHDADMLLADPPERVRKLVIPSVIKTYLGMLAAYEKGNVEEFNEALVKYEEVLDRYAPEAQGAVGFETFFNHASPFFHLQHLYMLVFLFGCLSWVAWSEPFRKAGLYLAILTLSVHTLSLLARMYMMQRPFVFVTNLYSSAIFIGWGAVMTGVILDFIFKNGIGVAAAGAVGYTTLLIANFLSLSGDTLDPLQAVLDTNFWLATHVTTVTFGYTATFFAGAIGIAFIVLGLFTPMMTAERSQTVGKMLYGVTCFAMMLSFVGTVLGGIWADQSWGRFWGWDPKENGALLIVIWNALILHARWGGMIKLRGMACLAVFGTIVTSWSWFGTNMLSVGLHAYGFMEGAFFWLLAFDISQLVIIGLGLIPLDYWMSYHRTRKPLPKRDDGWPQISTTGATS
jgi:ABC-type transport system involved in cytochrome c biogenesis permease subunit